MLQFLRKKAGKAYRSLKVRASYLTGKAYSYQPYNIKPPAAMRQDQPRVLHFIGNFFTGGSSRLVVDLLEHLGGEYEQQIITQRVARPAAYIGAVITEYDKSQTDQMLAYVHRYKPDFVHVHYWGSSDLPWYAAVFGVLEQVGCRVIENVNVPVAPYISATVQTYVYVSRYVLDCFGTAGAENRVVHPGSDFDLFRKGRAVAAAHTIGMVYRLDTDKLNEQSIDVFIKVAESNPKVKCLIVGGGTLLTLFKQKTVEAGVAHNFEFTGYVSYEKLPSLYRRMGIFVAPVWQESFGQVTPFAMSTGIPVVGYNIGALEEIIGDPSQLAPGNDSDRLAEIILRLLDDRPRRQAIGDFNRNRALEGFSIQKMIGEYRSLYAETAQSNKPTIIS